MKNYLLTDLAKDIVNLIGKKKTTYLFFLTVIISIVEVFGTISIYPFLEIATNPEIIFRNNYYNFLYNYFNFENQKKFTIFFGMMIFIFFFTTTAISLIVNYKIIIELQIVSATASDKILTYLINSKKLINYDISPSNLVRIIVQDTNRFSSSAFALLSLTTKGLILILFFSILFYTNFKITLISFFLFSLTYLLIYLIIQKRLKKNGSLITEEQFKRIHIVNDISSGIREFTLFNKLDIFLNKFKRASYNFAKAVGQNTAITTLPRNLVELLLYLGIISSVLYIFTFKELNFKLIIPTLGLYFIIFIRSFPAFQQIYSSYSSIKSNINAILEIKKLVNLKKINNKFRKKKSIKINSNIHLKNINFSFKNKKILNNLSLKISKGDKIAIIGKTGSGKTTLINLILGFLNFDKGVYLIDNKIKFDENINIYNNFSFVPQNIYLTNSSIKKNTVFGSDSTKINNLLLREVLKTSQLSNFLQNNKDGLRRNVGERGLSLSGGQMQRLGIARALYSNKNIVIFDEATSALDLKTEKKITERIFNLYKDKTIIFITHKKNFLNYFDKVFLLNDGKLKKISKIRKLWEKK